MYVSRDATSVTSTGWIDNWSNDVEYTTYALDNAITFDNTKMSEIFSTKVELDIPYTKENPINGSGDFYLTNGLILLITMQPKSTGSDDVSVTLEWGSEK